MSYVWNSIKSYVFHDREYPEIPESCFPDEMPENIKKEVILHKNELLSRKGLATKDSIGRHYRTWVCIHKGGLLFTHASNDTFYAFKSRILAKHGECYEVTWRTYCTQPFFDERLNPKFDKPPYTFSRELESVFSKTTRVEPQRIDFPCDNVSTEDLEKIKQIFGETRPGLPPSLEKKLYPSRTYLTPILGGVALIAGIAFVAFKLDLLPVARIAKQIFEK